MSVSLHTFSSAAAEALSQGQTVPLILVLLLFRATEELVALHGCQVIRISSSLQTGGLANHTFEINLLLVLLVIHLPIPTGDRLSLDV